MEAVRFIPSEIATKLTVALGIGLIVGFEREWSHKDLGVRTFAIVSLLGMLCMLGSPVFAWIGMAGVVVVVGLMNAGNLLQRRELETTTSAALLVVFILGVLVGQGHIFTPTASAVLMTLLLGLKPQLRRFAGGVTAEEIRGAVLLGLIGFVIYPVLPRVPIDPWGLVNPHETWLTVFLIAGLGFVNYVLLRVYGSRGLFYTAVFGGLVNSTAAVAELSNAIGKNDGFDGRMIALSMITIMAMFIRNLAVLAVFSPAAGLIAAWPIAAMAIFTAVFALRRTQASGPTPTVQTSSPIAIRSVLSFGVFFLTIQIVSTLGQRYFGEVGSILVSFLGGLVSSASATAAAGSLAAHGTINPRTAAISTVLACIASAAINLPIVYRTMKDRKVFRRYVILSSITTLIGLVALLAISVMGK
ncbi:MAG TPA: DUF4010 domain-containing protein [Bryobacteraceae bacterium]|jgi:uncharacterized membrane protein (DUF4010 family)|nr:DUF4010 domain-containing protein [Bryobacteraceae bacterium]